MPRLAGKIAVIAGGTGTVGEAIVRDFLNEGATVLVPSRSEPAMERLRAYLAGMPTDRLHLLQVDISTETGAAQCRAQILNQFSSIDAVVASLGGTWEEKLNLVDVPMETWEQYWRSNLTPHYMAARTFLPLLAKRPGSSYTLLGGISAVYPIPQYSVVAVNSAAQLMLAKILMEESKESLTRINQVMFGYINTRARASYARPEWITAAEVGRFCTYLASDEASMVSGGILQLGNLKRS